MLVKLKVLFLIRQFSVLISVAIFAVFRLSGMASAAAWTDVYYELGNNNSQSGNTLIPANHVNDNTGQPVTTFQTIGGKATVNASASVGVLRAGLWDTSDVPSVAFTGVSDETWSHAAASFFDFITINPQNSALIGQTVTVNSSFLLSGSMLWNVNVLNNNSLYYDVWAKTNLSVSGTGIPGFVTAQENHRRSGTGGTPVLDVSVPAPSVIPVSFTATLGSLKGIQYNLDLQGYSSASFGFRECGGGYGPCSAQASAELTSDYAHSLPWGGISSVTDGEGDPINFNVTSDSGFDYAAPVAPEPVSSILFITGGALLAGRKYLRSAKARKAKVQK